MTLADVLAIVTVLLSAIGMTALILWRMHVTLTAMEQRLTDRMEAQIAALATRIAALKTRVGGLAERVAKIEGWLGKHFNARKDGGDHDAD